MRQLFVIILSSIASLCLGQNIITLDQPESGNKTHVARQKIKLSNGYKYTPGNGPKLHLFIDESQTINDVDGENPLYNVINFNEDINTALSVGSTPGNADVSNTGSATYRVPILTPPGTQNLVPNLSIVYNSQAGDGQLGTGWGLSGLSSISRTSKNIYNDDKVEGVTFSLTDNYSFDGTRLIKTSGAQGLDGSVYQPEVESFTKITAKGSSGNGPSWFLIETKGGITMECGNSSDSKFKEEGSNTVLLWRVNKIYDCYGNYMEFKYLNNDRESRIDEILYTGNSNSGLQPYNKVKFSYDDRSYENETYTAGSSLSSKHLLSDILITGEDGLVFKNYELKYAKNDIHSFLQEIVEHGSEGKELNATRFLYHSLDHTVGNQVSNIVSNQDADVFSGDFNGDGKSDILSANFAFQNSVKYHTSLKVHLRGSSNFNNSSTNIALPQNWNKVEGFGIPNSFVAQDYDGDSQDDILISELTPTSSGKIYIDKIRIYYPNSSVSSFSSTVYDWDPPVGNSNNKFFYAGENHFISGDFDGDGRKDFIVFYKYLDASSNEEYEARICFPGISSTLHLLDETIHVESWFDAKSVRPVDFDGDGKDDIMITGTYINGWPGFDKTKIFTVTEDASGNPDLDQLYTSDIFTADHEIYIADFNGDRKTDILSENASGNWNISYSTGTTFLTQSFQFEEDVDLTPNSNHKLSIGDHNGDGLNDILHTYPSNSALNFDLYYSRGKTFFHYHHLEPPNNQASNTGLNVIGDYNGDGRTDILIRNGNTGNMLTYFLNEFDKGGLLRKVSNGFNQITEFGYTPMPGTNTYTKGNNSNYPVMDLEIPMYLVYEMKVPDGIGGINTTEFSYEKAKVHLEGRGFLGFEKVTRSIPNYNSKVVSEYELNSNYYVPAIKKVSTYRLSTNALLSQSTYSNQFINRGNNRFWSRVQSVSSIDNLNDKTTTSTTNYDNNGNVTSQIVNDGVEQTTTAYSSFNSSCSWLPNKPQYITTTRTRPGVPNYSSQVRCYYNSNGLKYKQIAFNGQDKALTTHYTNIDNFGNARTVTVSASGLTSRVTKMVYDSKGRFPITNTNPLNQNTTYEYDPLWGKPTKSTSIDGLVTEYDYDGYGRLRKTITPEGHAITTDWIWQVQNGTGTSTTSVNNAVYYTLTSAPSSPDQEIRYDRYNRVRQTATRNFNDQWTKVVTSYDHKGNTKTVTTPFVNTSTAVVTTNSYDDYNRMLTSSNSIGTTSYVYSSNNGETTVTTTTPSNQVTSATVDASGKLIATTDSGGDVTTTYFAHGGQKEVKVNGQVTASFLYDNYARQTQLNDVNGGIITREYDAFQQLVYEKDAGNHEHFYFYDQIGRLDYEQLPEGIIDYQYITSGYGINQLFKVTGFNGITTQYAYDKFSRTTAKIEFVDGSFYLTGFKYDEYGNNTKVTYPSGLEVNKTYNSRGYLDIVKDGSNVTLFNAQETNAFGQYTKYTLGNGKTSEMTYDQYGIPERFYTPGIQDLNFTFNHQTGNLEDRDDNIKGKYESFTYDNLNRLKSSTVSGQSSLTVNYSDNGNIDFKSDAGTYTYGSPKINALTEITANNTAISLMQQDIAYNNSFDQPDQITEGAYQLDFTYGVDLERKKTVLKHNGSVDKTTYYFDSYEKIITGGNTKHLHYITEGDGLTAIVVRENGQDTYYYTYQDYLGSILTVTNAQGNVVYEQNFDAWGRNRNANTWNYNNIATSPDWLIRGYTSHEQLPQFDLINMNGRLYDPVVGRMLSVDNFVSSPNSTQGYNRYSYVMNNPLKYTDPDGEWVQLAYAAIAVATNGVLNTANGNNFFQGWAEAAVGGAVSGSYWGSAISSVNSHLPSLSLTMDNLSFSISPAIMLGDVGFGLGANFSASVSHNGGSFGLSGGFTAWNKHAVTHGKQFLETRLSRGFSFGREDGLNIGLSSATFGGGGISQQSGGLTIGGRGWAVAYENDWLFGTGAGDQGDRWRTGGIRIFLPGDASFGVNVFTGDPGGVTQESRNKNVYPDPSLPNESNEQPYYVNPESDLYRGGVLTLGYKNIRIGVNSEKVRVGFQHTIHKLIGKPFFNELYDKYPTKIYSSYQNPNPYTIW